MAIEQLEGCDSGALTIEDSFVQLDKYYEQIWLKKEGGYVACSGPSRLRRS